jgi:TonB family protein
MSAATFPLAGPAPKRDYDVVRRRTRFTMTISFCAHLLLMLWLVVLKPVTEKAPEFTEILMLEPGDLAPRAAAAAPSGSEIKGMPRPSAREERFTRALNNAEIVPQPQTTAAADRIAARLASLQSRELATVSGVANSGLPTGVLGSVAGAQGSTGAGSGPISLTRGGAGSGSGPALSLTRGGSGVGTGPAVVATGLPAGASEASAPARGGESTARRNLAGAQLMGPVANRPILQYTRPVYPEWAKRDAVEGRVTLYFVVRPDGSIKENVLVQKTAGFEDFDENARTALRAWRFQPLTGGRTGEQWGTITFHFRLTEPS